MCDETLKVVKQLTTFELKRIHKKNTIVINPKFYN